MSRLCPVRVAGAITVPAYFRWAVLAGLLVGGCSQQSPLLPPRPDAEAVPLPDVSVLPPDAAIEEPPPPPPSSIRPGAGGGPSCALDADCGRGFRCVAARCAPGCRYHEECTQGTTPACGPHGICQGSQPPPLDAPLLSRVHSIEPSRFRVTDEKQGCYSPLLVDLPPLDAVRLDALGETVRGGRPDEAPLITRHPDDCTFEVEAPVARPGRHATRIRAVTDRGIDWVEYDRTHGFGRRYVAVLRVNAGEGTLRLPLVFAFDAPPGDGATAGVVEASGTPFFVADRPLSFAVDDTGWRITARDLRGSRLLGGPFSAAPLVSTSLRVELAPPADGDFMLAGTFTLAISDGVDALQLSGEARAWPAPEADISLPSLAGVGQPSQPLDDFARRCPLRFRPDHLDGIALARCIAGDGCCAGPIPWSVCITPSVASLWQRLNDAWWGIDPHLVKLCAAPVESCVPGPVPGAAAICDPGAAAADHDPCLEWRDCDGGDPCRPGSAIGDTGHASCADALDPSRLEDAVPFSATAPPCLDPLRALCAAELYRGAGRLAGAVDWPAVDRLHEGLLRGGLTAVATAGEARDRAGLEAARARLELPLRALLGRDWWPDLRGDSPPSEALVMAFGHAALRWAELTHRLVLDPRLTPGEQAQAQHEAIDGLALVEWLRASARCVGCSPPAELDAIERALARTVERSLWTLAERRARPDEVVLSPGSAARVIAEALTGNDPLDAIEPDRLPETLLDAALALSDRAEVEFGRLAARRADLRRWAYRPQHSAVEGMAHQVDPPDGPAHLLEIKAERGRLARHPLVTAHHVAASDAAAIAADVLARLTAPDDPPLEPVPKDMLLAWPPANLPALIGEWEGDRRFRAEDLDWFRTLDAERLAAQRTLDVITATLPRLRVAHRLSVRAVLARTLRQSPLLNGTSPDPAAAAEMELARACEHACAADRDLTMICVRVTCDVFGACSSTGGECSGADGLDRDPISEDLAVTALRDVVASETVLPDAQWRTHLSRAMARHDGEVVIDLDLVPEGEWCGQRLTEVAIRGQLPSGGWVGLPDARIELDEPRLDHRCGDGLPVQVLVEPAVYSSGRIEPSHAIPPGGHWRLRLPPPVLGAHEPGPRDLADVELRLHLGAPTASTFCPPCPTEEPDDDAP